MSTHLQLSLKYLSSGRGQWASPPLLERTGRWDAHPGRIGRAWQWDLLEPRHDVSVRTAVVRTAEFHGQFGWLFGGSVWGGSAETRSTSRKYHHSELGIPGMTRLNRLVVLDGKKWSRV